MKSLTRLLLVEDEVVARERLLGCLDPELFEIETADSLQLAEELFEWWQPRIVLLDIRLPDGSGFSFLRKLKKRLDVGVIVITSLDRLDDRLKGLDLGADYFLHKPVDGKELRYTLARLHERVNLVNRLQPTGSGRFRFQDLMLDLAAGTLVRAGGEVIPLTRTEFEILRVMLENPGVVLSRDRILVLTGRGEQEVMGRAIDSAITRLRHKIEPDPKAPTFIHTVHRQGYRFSIQAERV